MHLEVVRSVDPKVIENFLLSQSEVVDASVWFKGGRLMAHVTLLEGSEETDETLRGACRNELGWLLTPSEIVLLSAKRRIA